METVKESQPALHYGIVEMGKVYCLEGNYGEALRHYREGIRLCTTGEKKPEVFFQHYTQCVMEALELSGTYDEVISYCEKTKSFLEPKLEDSDFTKRYYASLLEREAIQYIHKEEKESATQLLKEAQALVGRKTQPITDEILNWLLRGYQISSKQIREIQKRYNYFTVREGKVNKNIAIELPKTITPF